MLPTSGLHIDQAPPLHLPLRFFATGVLLLAATSGLLLLEGTNLLNEPLGSANLAWVHGVVLGWLSMTMFGALYQMIPVLAGIRVPGFGLIPWVHATWTLGVLLLAGSLWNMASAPWLISAWIMLGGALAGIVLPVGWALWQAPSRHPTVEAMRLSLLMLLLTVGLGLFFLYEHVWGFAPVDRMSLVVSHLSLGLGGWMLLLLLGVSFQVLPMFYMTAEFPRHRARWILAGLVLGVVTTPPVLLLDLPAPWRWGPWLPVMPALTAYTFSMGALLRQRRRRLTDATLLFWYQGFAGLGLGVVGMLASQVMAETPTALPLAAFVLFTCGGVGPIVLGMLHKIIPFLVWFHRFSRLAGLVDIPMMDDLTPRGVVCWHPWVHGLATLLLTLSVVLHSAPLLLLGGGVLLLSALLMGAVMIHALSRAVPSLPEPVDFASFFKDMPGMTTPGNPEDM
ncbi:MAG: hypothetical protein H7831_13855 [Magnetococcus sp. WYHC-3]